MNLELKEFWDIVENRINNYWDNEIPRLEPASATSKINIKQLLAPSQAKAS